MLHPCWLDGWEWVGSYGSGCLDSSPCWGLPCLEQLHPWAYGVHELIIIDRGIVLSPMMAGFYPLLGCRPGRIYYHSWIFRHAHISRSTKTGHAAPYYQHLREVEWGWKVGSEFNGFAEPDVRVPHMYPAIGTEDDKESMHGRGDALVVQGSVLAANRIQGILCLSRVPWMTKSLPRAK